MDGTKQCQLVDWAVLIMLEKFIKHHTGVGRVL